MNAPGTLSTRRHSAVNAPPKPLGDGGSKTCSGGGELRANLGPTADRRKNASRVYSTASPARAANGRAESDTGSPRAAWPSSTAIYQRSGRIVLHNCAKAFIPKVRK